MRSLRFRWEYEHTDAPLGFTMRLVKPALAGAGPGMHGEVVGTVSRSVDRSVGRSVGRSVAKANIGGQAAGRVGLQALHA